MYELVNLLQQRCYCTISVSGAFEKIAFFTVSQNGKPVASSFVEDTAASTDPSYAVVNYKKSLAIEKNDEIDSVLKLYTT